MSDPPLLPGTANPAAPPPSRGRSRRVAKIVGALVAVLFALFFMLATGLLFIVQAAWLLALGWATFVVETLPNVTVSWGSVATAAATTALLAVGVHRFLRWVWPLARPGVGSWRPRWTAVLLSLLALLFGTSVASVGIAHQIGWLATGPPLIENSWLRDATTLSALESACVDLFERNRRGTATELRERLWSDARLRKRLLDLQVVPVARPDGALAAVVVRSRHPGLARNVFRCSEQGAQQQTDVTIAEMIARRP